MERNKSAAFKKYLCIVSAFLIIAATGTASAKPVRKKSYEDYLEKYKSLAIKHMKDYKVPASITLGQGLLESGAGLSDLSQKTNNHFGIKCSGDWKGPCVTAKDDTPYDKFRKYGKVEDSYEDHSRFLAEKSRYRFLFDLNITDYAGWARGLQKAGYATDKAYANKLIKLIEDYELYRYDKTDKKKSQKEMEKELTADYKTYRHQPYKTGGLVYVVAQEDDSYEAIALEFGFKVKDLYKYNEVPEDFPLQPGNLVYFEKKKKKADKPYYEHEVKIGESMHSISQLYGIRVENLYKMNRKDSEYVPTEGDVLKLR
ncbi:MAG: glucosaminidase domain-containing protein [Prevotella sp.]|jgi:LysM repeat protein|nr:glucosaminidase domain-containing protein [Prevotella sp.]